MKLIPVILAFLELVKTEHFLGVNYSFDIDFYRHFDNKGCDENSMWQLVKYGSLDVEPPFGDSDRAIRAAEYSCSSSFPIIFVRGVLDINVYARVISRFFKLSIDVFDEYDTSVTSYVYQKSSEGFGQGWRKISLTINKHVKGYVHLRGNSLSNEILLIDSIHYTPNNTFDHDYRRVKRSVTHEPENEDGVNQSLKTNFGKYEIYESSGDGDDISDPPQEEIVKRGTFWNVFTITIIAFGGIIVLAIIMVGAYHCGKVIARRKDPLQILDIEPPRTVVLPRVAATSNPNTRLVEY